MFAKDSKEIRKPEGPTQDILQALRWLIHFSKGSEYNAVADMWRFEDEKVKILAWRTKDDANKYAFEEKFMVFLKGKLMISVLESAPDDQTFLVYRPGKWEEYIRYTLPMLHKGADFDVNFSEVDDKKLFED